MGLIENQSISDLGFQARGFCFSICWVDASQVCAMGLVLVAVLASRYIFTHISRGVPTLNTAAWALDRLPSSCLPSVTRHCTRQSVWYLIVGGGPPRGGLSGSHHSFIACLCAEGGTIIYLYLVQLPFCCCHVLSGCGDVDHYQCRTLRETGKPRAKDGSSTSIYCTQPTGLELGWAGLNKSWLEHWKSTAMRWADTPNRQTPSGMNCHFHALLCSLQQIKIHRTSFQESAAGRASSLGGGGTVRAELPPSAACRACSVQRASSVYPRLDRPANGLPPSSHAQPAGHGSGGHSCVRSARQGGRLATMEQGTGKGKLRVLCFVCEEKRS
ncbi:hypothetical protein B0T22DRAFT_135777 [Podospora appendiculata]|uniref:Uncharacterized protein n=1 Tax=Podospora appendiculata TaxID=314037 RepID=A0AAE0X7S2_9PEZI|nr:hypothetical protein B0T22DRAFT_135777 [Podospora appendiculata]